MREQLDRWVGIGSIAAIVAVPAILVVTPWERDEPAEVNAGERVPVGNAAPPLSPPPSPTPPDGREDALPPPPSDAPGSESREPTTRRPGNYLAADDGARITGVKWDGERRADLSVASPALGSTRKVRLIVPRTWSDTATRTWPIVYAFHGGNDTYTAWTRKSDITRVAAGYGVLVAMPEGANGSYTDWYNKGAGGPPKWETFHTIEVPQLLERNFGAGRARAAMGLSSGAQGAVTYAARHPGMFKYAAAYSGVLSMLSPGIPTLLLYLNSEDGQDATRIWGDPLWDRGNWAAHDPASLVRDLRGTRVHVSAGNGRPGPFDPPGRAFWDVRYLSESQVERTSRTFASRARSAGVPITTNFYGAGSHSWGYWNREMHSTWPAMMRAIQADEF
jgi:S-formylglutathione hydrolase FrmB